MKSSLEHTLTPSALMRQAIGPNFRALMDAMIALVRKFGMFEGAPRQGWAA